MRRCHVLTLALATVLPSIGAAAQSPIPVRDLPPAEAVSRDTVGFLYGIRELPGGSVLVSDAGNRRLLLFERTLATATTVADTMGGTALAYGKRATSIMPFTGDSTIFVDLTGRALLVLDARGAVARVMSPPRPADITALANPALGAPGFDGGGRLIYRGTLFAQFKAPEKGKPYAAPAIPDSAPILRGDFDTRVADTLAWVRVPKIKASVAYLENGGVRLSPMVTPISVVDDWAMLADGTIAIVRGQDYHVDWIDPDGTRRSSPKMTFDWKRLTDEEKVAIVDSAKLILAKQSAAGATAAAGAVAGGPGGHGAPMPGSGHGMTIMPVGTPNDGSPTPVANTASGSASSGEFVTQVVPPSDLPDYLPPVYRAGQMKADGAGNLWVLPSTSAQSGGGLVYDVIDRKGAIFARVRLPKGRALQGFGADGAVYMTAHDGAGARLERARLDRLVPAPDAGVKAP